MGIWGKNAMVLHPRFGPWLCLMSVKIISTALYSTGSGKDSHDENPVCKDCIVCIDVGPVSILELYYLRDRNSCFWRTLLEKGAGWFIAALTGRSARFTPKCSIYTRRLLYFIPHTWVYAYMGAGSLGGGIFEAIRRPAQITD